MVESWDGLWSFSMDPSSLASTVQASFGVMVRGIFSWYILGRLVPVEYYCWPCRQCSHLLMATSRRIMHHVTKLKSS